MAKRIYTFMVLFAGAGGLSEGYISVGGILIAYKGMGKYVCDTTLKTRDSFLLSTKKPHNRGITSLKQTVSALKIVEKTKELIYDAN